MTATEATDDVVSTACGHKTPREGVISVAEVGYVCRTCHTPIPLKRWESVIDASEVNHRTGETTHYSTWLVGLDEIGRAVYFDERENNILVLVPKYHRAFQPDVDGDEKPFRKRPPKFGGGPGKIVNAPDNGVLVLSDQVSFDSTPSPHRQLSEWLTEQTTDGSWSAISDTTIDKLEYYADAYDKPSYSDDVFPVAEAREIIEAYRDD